MTFQNSFTVTRHITHCIRLVQKLLVSASRDHKIWKISKFSDNVFVLPKVFCHCIPIYIFFFSLKLQRARRLIWETKVYETDLSFPAGLQFRRFFAISFIRDSRLKYVYICLLGKFFLYIIGQPLFQVSHIYLKFFCWHKPLAKLSELSYSPNHEKIEKWLFWHTTICSRAETSKMRKELKLWSPSYRISDNVNFQNRQKFGYSAGKGHKHRPPGKI